VNAGNIVYLIDVIKKKFKTHTLKSATVLPIDELHDEELDFVVGGMNKESFDLWCIEIINKNNQKS